MAVKNENITIAEMQMQLAMRKYAKANKIAILAYHKESFSNELIGIAVQQSTKYDGNPYFTFGRIYRVFAEDCVYHQQGCASFDDFEEAKEHALLFFGRKTEKTVSAEQIKKAVNNSLSYYPWGGECIEVRKNQWDEWIVDCHVWGQYGRSPEDPKWRYYKTGDKDCPIRQFMVSLYILRPISEPYKDSLIISLWEAKDNKRLPTFPEEAMCYDPSSPPSPYIVEPIRAYYETHKNDPNPFEND